MALPSRNGKDDSLRVLLCETSDVTPATGGGGGSVNAAAAAAAADDNDADDDADGVDKWRWPAAVEGLIRRHGLIPELAKVPGQAPRTREQWEEWNAVWPIVWQKPNSHLSAPLEAPGEEEVADMKRWMLRAISSAAAAAATLATVKSTTATTEGARGDGDGDGDSDGVDRSGGAGQCGDACNAVLIVDPVAAGVVPVHSSFHRSITSVNYIGQLHRSIRFHGQFHG